jgi:hypothetical protein
MHRHLLSRTRDTATRNPLVAPCRAHAVHDRAVGRTWRGAPALAADTYRQASPPRIVFVPLLVGGAPERSPRTPFC